MKLNSVRRGPVSVRAIQAMFLSNKFGSRKEHLSAMDLHYLSIYLISQQHHQPIFALLNQFFQVAANRFDLIGQK